MAYMTDTALPCSFMERSIFLRPLAIDPQGGGISFTEDRIRFDAGRLQALK
jgi:hypothetical protein